MKKNSNIREIEKLESCKNRQQNKVKSDGVNSTRDEKLKYLRSINIMKLKPYEIENVKNLILNLESDDILEFLLYLINNYYDFEEDNNVDKKKNKFILSFLKDPRFEDFEKILINNLIN